MGVVVTGGCGFIGSHLVRYLAERGIDVTIIDNLSRSSPRVVREISESGRVGLKVVDIRDREELGRATSGDAVFHLAALTDVAESEIDRKSYWDVNVTGTVNVVDVAIERGMKVIFASSAAVYGPLEVPAVEDLSPSPISFYGYTKLMAEKKILEHADKVEVVILRIFNVYGEDARSGVVKNFLDSALDMRPLTVYGDGENVRDFVYVEDVVEAFYDAYTRPLPSGTVVNIGSGIPVKIIELARFISERVGTGIVFTDPRKNEVRYSVADISRARRLLGWRPRRDLFSWILEKLGNPRAGSQRPLL